MGLVKGLSTHLVACAALLAGGVACTDLGTVGDDGGDDTGMGTLGLTCEAELSLTGSFEPVGTGLSEDGDCDPVGTWTVRAEVSDPGDCAEVPLEAEYVYTVIRDEYGYLVTYAQDPESLYSFTKVTIEGPCMGNFEHFSEDGTQRTLLKPYTTEDLTAFAGVGAYEVYDGDQLPPEE
jgi:hypothetical protein